MSERYYVDLRVTGNKIDLGDFLLLCRKIEYLCNVGASRELKVVVDGDGSADLQFDFKGVKVNIDKKDFEKQIGSGKDLKIIYIGE